MDDFYYGQQSAAQELIYQAWEAPTLKQQYQLAEKRLQMEGDCVDAYIVLAQHAVTIDAAYDLYLKGVEIADRLLTVQLEQDVGHFWGLFETRPFMRAHLQLAMTAWQLGNQQEAIQRLWRHLQLNPNDNQGARDVLLGYLQTVKDEAGLDKLCQLFPFMTEIRDVPQPPMLMHRQLEWAVQRSDWLRALYQAGVEGLQNLIAMPQEQLQAIKGIGAKTAPRLQTVAQAFLQRAPYWSTPLAEQFTKSLICLDVRVHPDVKPQRPWGFVACSNMNITSC